MRRAVHSSADAFNLLDRVTHWNAQIAVRLRHVIKVFHQTTPGHGRDGWQHCPHEECVRVAKLLSVDLLE